MNTTFWDVIPHSPVESHRWFGGTYCLQLLFDSTLLTLLDLLFGADDGGSTFLRNVCILLPDYMAIHPRNSHRLPWCSVVAPGGILQHAMTVSFQIIRNHFTISAPHNTCR
jgi:hypothetical protein